ncbi:MAG: Ig-like domain-containing protein [Eubacteriales bacterium]|nr:Ig-like domain-containing protein [Eubacteriales bacterium]
MKRTIALVMSLLMLLVLVPTTALADTDVHPYLEVTPVAVAPDTTPTLFQFGTDLTFNWTNANLVVKIFDDNADPAPAGRVLTLGTTLTADTYVLYFNGAIYNPATPYTFLASDVGVKTLTVKYTYKPAGNTNSVTVTKDFTISIQRNVLQSITVSGPAQDSYYAGEYLNLSGLVVKGIYSNMTDPVVLDSSKYSLRLYKDDAGEIKNEISVSDPLTVQDTLKVSVTEKYPGSEDEVTKTAPAKIVVADAITSLSITPTEKEVTLGTDGPFYIESDVVSSGSFPYASLSASVDKPAIAAIDTSTLTTDGKVKVTPLSIGTAIVTIRARGTDYSDPLNPKNYSKTVTITVKKEDVHVNSLVLDKSSLTLPVNGTYTLTATVGPDDAANKTITWSVETDRESDVSVDSTGTVKVLRNFSGDVTITATANGTAPGSTIKQNCLISVNSIAVDGIAISNTSATLYKGSWKQLSAVITPSGAADPAVTWSSSNESIVKVDSTGKITAVGTIKSGDTVINEAVITAQSSNASVFATCTVKVLDAVLITSLTLNKSELALNVGDEETLQVTGSPSNATNKTLLWKSSNPEVASVSAGKVIAASKGSAVIRAEATDGSGKYVSCVVTVNNIQILNVYLDKSSLDLSEGDTAKVTATVYPSNATTSNLKWTSSNSSVATVDSKGNVVAGATKGYSIITASATDGSGKFAECVVLSKPRVHVTGMTINYGTSLDLLANDSTYLKATILPANATVSNVTWSSSNTAVATVDASTGLLKGLTLGSATITATADGKSVTININVTNTEYNYGVATNFRRRVNVRTSASGLSKAVGFAYIGDTFRILGKTGNWYLIQYNNTTKAYIWASYLKASKTSSSYVSANGTTSTTGPSASPGTVTTPTKVTIANCLYAVNIRASASTSSKRIGKGSLGATFTYLGKEGDWYKIQYNTTTVAYVYGTFVSLS